VSRAIKWLIPNLVSKIATDIAKKHPLRWSYIVERRILKSLLPVNDVDTQKPTSPEMEKNLSIILYCLIMKD